MVRHSESNRELEWLAYMAQQLGWHGLAQRIARDAAELHKKTEQLQRAEIETHAALASYQKAVLENKHAFTMDEKRPACNLLRELDESWREAERAHSALPDKDALAKRWEDISGKS